MRGENTNVLADGQDVHRVEDEGVAHDFREGVDVEFLNAACFCNAASPWEFIGGRPSLSSALSAPSTVAMPTATTAAATTPVPAATAAVARLEIFNLGSCVNECEDLVSRRGRCLGHGIGHLGHGVVHEIS